MDNTEQKQPTGEASLETASHETQEEQKKPEVKEPLEVKLPTPEELGIFPNDDQKSEVVEEKSEEKPAEESKPEKREYTKTEKSAMAKGWKPLEQFSGDKSEWRSAKEFMDRGELLDKITSYHKEVKNLRKTNDHMTNLVNKMSSKLDEKEQSDLILARNQAIESGDVNTVNLIDKKIEEVRKAQVQEQQQIQPELIQFQEENNDWFNQNSPENKMMHDYAVMTDNYLMQQYPSLTLSERLEKTKQTVMKAYPERFKPKVEAPVPVRDYKPDFPTVENSKPIPKKKQEITFNDMPDEVKTIIKNFCRYNKKISKDQYAKDLVRSGTVTL